MSRSQIYQLNDYETLDLTEASGDTATPVAGIQGVTAIPSASLESLYTGDSSKRADTFQHEFNVQVEINYAFFDGAVVEHWLGGSGSSGGSWTDTSDPQDFEITGDFRSRDGSNALEFTITGINFPEMPILDISRGEYAQWDLSGEGDDVTNFSVGTPSA